jgi:hypothetical protein
VLFGRGAGPLVSTGPVGRHACGWSFTGLTGPDDPEKPEPVPGTL